MEASRTTVRPRVLKTAIPCVVALCLSAAGCSMLSGDKAGVRAGGNFELTERNRNTGDITSIQDLSAGAVDPVKGTISGVRVDLYEVTVPRGAVSANEAFWKPVDEDSKLDRARYEALFVNGFRAGVARAEQWAYFREIIAKSPNATKSRTLSVLEEASASVPTRRGIESQTLSFFAAGQPVEMRTFPSSDNWINFSFAAAPQRDDACRVAMTPLVRSTREKMEYSPTNVEMPLKYVKTERLYELNLSVEITFGEFLVVSPSTDVARETSIGRNFMLVDEDAEQKELVLLIVPSKIEGKATKAEPAKPAEEVNKVQ